jgi:FkbM family methyltransferase
MISPLLLSRFADFHERVFFIEIGANDGVSFDPLRPYLKRPGWAGLMVEPVPYLFERLLAEHGDSDRITLANLAVGDCDGVRAIHHLQADAKHPGLPPWKDQIASFDRAHVLAELAELPEAEAAALLTATTVPCVSFEALCAEYGVENLDLLLVDTEGTDYEILTGIDFAAHRPRLLTFEHHHMSAEQRAEIASRLERIGYRLVTEGLDTWCLDVSPADRLSEHWRAAADYHDRA